MDTHDVSDIPQYLQLLRKQQKSLQVAQRFKGQRPQKKQSRNELIMQFNLGLMMKMTMPTTDGNLMRTAFIPPAYIPCVTPLSGLQKVMMEDLRLETHHRGVYLQLRTVTPPDRMTAIMAIVEDEKGDIFVLQLYYQAGEEERTAEEILPEGVVLIVKEPYLKTMADGNYGIRVDHLSDISFDVQESIPIQWRRKAHEEHVPASTSKERGNNCFNKSKYFEAIEHYSQGIAGSEIEEEADTLRLNRALAYLRTQQFDAALSDLDHPSATAKPTEKALFRKGQALYNLRRYRESAEVLKVLCIEHPSELASTELKRTISRLTEQETGVYQFKKMYEEATEFRPPHLDHATYVGSVEVRKSDSRGRGLFTTAAVKAGDLLLCEKAFAHAFHDSSKKKGKDDNVALLIIPESNSMSMGTQTELIETIIRKLHRNPSLMPGITDLHHGSYKPVDGIDVVDSFHIQNIVILNCFGCPLSSREAHLDSVTHNAIRQMEDNQHYHSTGIWPKASYINHCCYNNARRSFIGDMMIVRATQDLPANTEVTFWYHPPNRNGYSDRQKKLGHWKFQCDCSMCQDDKATDEGVIKMRKSLRAELKKCSLPHARPSTAKLETLIASVAKTYTQPALKVPRLAIWDALLAISQMYMSLQQPIKAIESALACLASLGYVVEGGKKTPLVIRRWGLFEDNLVECWLLVCAAYSTLGQQSFALRAYEYAKISYRICVGEDESFQEIYGKPENVYRRATY